MDKLRTFFVQVKKYHFWILCVLLVLVGLGGWWMAKSRLDEEATKNLEKIKAADQSVNAVKNTIPHPNADYHKAMDQIIHNHALSIGIGWKKQYERQKGLLVWPKLLGQEFIEQVDDLRPIEQHASYPVKDSEEIDPVYREIYRNFIIKVFPKLAEQIQAKWYAELGSGTGSESSSSGPSRPSRSTGSSGLRSSSSSSRGPAVGPRRTGSGLEEEEEDDSVVFWSETNQAEILRLHFGLASSADTPRTIDVLYAQEDLWVLDAIIKVIQRTNGDADANYNAPIKEIVSIQMGRTIVARMGVVSPVYKDPVSLSGISGGTAMPPGTGGPGPTGPTPAATPATMPTTSGPGTGPALEAMLDPAFGRYVDLDYNPLPPADLRNAPAATDAKLAVYAVAKRMPVRMRFFMDQRNLNDLLAECGNSSLPIEVRQVRINAPEGLVSNNITAAGSSSSYPGSSSSSSSYPGSQGSPMTTGSSSGASSSRSSRRQRPGSSSSSGRSASSSRPGSLSGGDSEGAVDPNEIEVEVFGIVHLYNPVNEKLLNIELQKPAETPAVPGVPAVPVTPTSAPVVPAATVPGS